MEAAITCTACRLPSTGSAERREHYRSDLHRVNLKRKVTGLGPLTQTELTQRLQALQAERQVSGREKQICELCHKKFSSRKALENHTQSKRHREAVMKLEMSVVDSDSYVGEVDEAGAEEVVLEGDMVLEEEDVEEELERRMREWRGEGFSGVFDESWHSCSRGAFAHARTTHGLFVPYEEFVKDWDGLMRYAGQKVGVGYACLCCDRGFGSADAARRHMKDVGHCRMGDDWVEEFGEFYRWSADDGWVEVDAAAGDAALRDGAEEVERDGAEVAGRLDGGGGDEFALVVRDKVVGHRSFARYYRQAVGRSDDLRVAVVANKSAVQELRMIGWRRMDRQAARAEKAETRRRQRFELVVGGNNYYTRKARFKQQMAVFNSGYRA